MADVLVSVAGHADQVDLLAGALCLDFVNTVEPRAASYHTDERRNYLTRYDDLIAWSVYVGDFDGGEAQTLLAESGRYPELAQAVLEDAIGLRETIYRIFLAIAQRQAPNTADLERLSAAYAECMVYARLAAVGDTFTVTWRNQPLSLARPLWPVIYSAVELLLRGESPRIKDCASGGEGCGWLFYDTSKNMSRRWCSMTSCGAEAKERRRGKRTRRGTT